MRKKTKSVKKFTHRRAPRAAGEFCVIQERLGKNTRERSWFTTEAEAVEEANAILTGGKVYPGYAVPERLVVVQAVCAVRARIVTRRVSPAVLSGQEDDHEDA